MSDNETWRPVLGFEGAYEVSDHGRVRSLDRRDTSGRSRRGRVLSAALRRDGHLCVRLYLANRGRTFDVHVLVAAAFIGPRGANEETRHLDGDPINNRRENLAYGTKSENNRDRVAHGTHHNAAKTHCPYRHPLVAPNLVASAERRGARTCLACSYERTHSHRKGIPFSGERANAQLDRILDRHKEKAA
jgi:hypothetical protein